MLNLNDKKTIRRKDLDSAIALFNDIAISNGVDKAKVNREESKLRMLDMSQTGAWLEPWMIKTEEMYRLLTGDKLFDVVYKESDRSILGVKAVDTKNMKNEVEKQKKEEDDEYEIDDDDIHGDKINNAPISLKFFVGEASFKMLFNIENNIVKMLEPNISLSKLDFDGFFVPLDKDSISMMAFKGYLDKTKTAMLNLSNEKELVNRKRKSQTPQKDT